MRRVRSRHDEGGVVAIALALITCFALIPLAAYAVDIGVQRVARRDMQAVADVVALDLARQLDGRTYSVLSPLMPDLAEKSAERNSGGAAVPAIKVELGTVNAAAWSATNPDAYFTPITSDAGGIPGAVRVTASGTVDFAIHGGSGGVVRTAIATAHDEACFKLGSYAAKLSSSTSTLLNPLLNDALNLSVVSYSGLATSSIKLGDLAAELGAGTPDELMALDNLSLNQLFTAAAHVLTKDGGNAANITLLNSLAAANFGSVTHSTVAFADIISLASGTSSAFETRVNLLDLVTTTAFVANGTNFLAIPDITAGIPGLAPSAVSASLKVIEKPMMTCGPVGTTSQDTSQVSLHLTVDLPEKNVSTVSIPLLGLTVYKAKTKLSVNVDLANGRGELTAVRCSPGNPDGIDVRVTSSVGTVSSTLDGSVYALLGLPLATISAGAGGAVLGSTGTVSIDVPPKAYDTPYTTASQPQLTQISSLTASNLTLLGLDAGLVSGVLSGLNTNVVNAFVTPLINNVNNQVVKPLTDALGLKLGGADVIMPGEHPPVCGAVSLAG